MKNLYDIGYGLVTVNFYVKNFNELMIESNYLVKEPNVNKPFRRFVVKSASIGPEIMRRLFLTLGTCLARCY